MSGIACSFGGSVGDELCTEPTIRQLAKNSGGKILLHKYSHTSLFYGNPNVEFGEPTDHKNIAFRFQASQEDLKYHLVDFHAMVAGIELNDRTPKLYLTSGDRVPLPKGRKIAIDTRAGWSTRRWPQSHYIKLIKLLKEKGYTVIEVGRFWVDCRGREDAVKLKKADISLVNRLTLKQTADVIRQCDALISTDSGLAHVAAAVDAKAITLFGTVNPEIREHKTTISITGTCRDLYCHMRHAQGDVCPTTYVECMTSITPEMVVEKL